MRLSEGLLLVGLTAGCKPGSVELEARLGSPYEAPDSEDTDDTAGDTDTNVDSGMDSGTDTATDTAEPCDTATEDPTREILTTTVDRCEDLLDETYRVNAAEFVVRNNAEEPSMNSSYQVSDVFRASLNPDYPSAEYESLIACARLTPVDRSHPVQTLGATTVQNLNTRMLDVELEGMDVETGSLNVWIGTQDTEAAFTGFTTPSEEDDSTARAYTVFWDGARYTVTR